MTTERKPYTRLIFHSVLLIFLTLLIAVQITLVQHQNQQQFNFFFAEPKYNKKPKPRPFKMVCFSDCYVRRCFSTWHRIPIHSKSIHYNCVCNYRSVKRRDIKMKEYSFCGEQIATRSAHLITPTKRYFLLSIKACIVVDFQYKRVRYQPEKKRIRIEWNRNRLVNLIFQRELSHGPPETFIIDKIVHVNAHIATHRRVSCIKFTFFVKLLAWPYFIDNEQRHSFPIPHKPVSVNEPYGKYIFAAVLVC